MKKSQIITSALINSLSTAIYVMLIAILLYSGEQGFFEKMNSAFIPIIMLMIFVFSAAFTGFLMLGKPVMWYLDNKKKEAVFLFFYTLAFFLIIILILFWFVM